MRLHDSEETQEYIKTPRAWHNNKKERVTMWENVVDFICGWGGTAIACAGVLYLGVMAWIGAGRVGEEKAVVENEEK